MLRTIGRLAGFISVIVLLTGFSKADAQSIYGKWEVQCSPYYFYYFSDAQKVSFDITKEYCVVTTVRKTPLSRGTDTNGVLHIDSGKIIIEIDSFKILSLRAAADGRSGVLIVAIKEGGLSKNLIYSAFSFKVVDDDHLILGRYQRPNFGELNILEENLPDTTTNPRSLLISSRKVEELSKLKNVATLTKKDVLVILEEYHRFVSEHLADYSQHL